MEHFRGKEEYHVPPRMHAHHGVQSHSRRYNNNNNNHNSYHEDENNNNPSMSSSLEDDWSWNEQPNQQLLMPAYQHGQPSPASKSTVTASPSHHSINPSDVHELISTSTSNLDSGACASPNLRGQHAMTQSQRGMNPRESEYPWHTPPRLQRMRRQQKREKKQRNHHHKGTRQARQTALMSMTPASTAASMHSPSYPYGQGQASSPAQPPWSYAMNMSMAMNVNMQYATGLPEMVPPMMYGGAAYLLPPSPLFIRDAYNALPAAETMVTPPQEPTTIAEQQHGDDTLLPMTIKQHMESMTLNHECSKSNVKQQTLSSTPNEFDREMDDITDIITLSIDELFGETSHKQ
eukprot:CAMPEP_0202730396 /NCGR_PEP_ID=MMETSP1385-20130828/186619_1 /ASSEMBLY_ACC=CAM_ASM_000861 /TAXON_ID=933848 /ORGANISM="Elphidium margaritaceum" /LENGTH=347 /DNA_ID=CAMNT_0049396669 /DNA_START=52 /DNA_END=1095 /DNA_ORIENTATION=-